MEEQTSSSTTVSVTPAANHALGLFQEALQRILVSCATRAAERGATCADLAQRGMEGRLKVAMSYYEPALRDIFDWLLRSEEESNFTYGLTQRNLEYLTAFVAVITKVPASAVRAYINELIGDNALRSHIDVLLRQPEVYMPMDLLWDFGRRLGWYAAVRALKPRLVVETGVAQGLGAVVLCSALLRNGAEGAPGRYLGTDIDRKAGYLLTDPYRAVGTIAYGDSIATLSALNVGIDIFINDSDHSADYELREYRTITPRLNAASLILGDNSHSTDSLYKFAMESGRQFLFFPEKPANHWYPGAGIGAAFG